MQHTMQHHYNYRSMQQQPKAIILCRTNFSKSPLHVCADSEFKSRNPKWPDLINSAVSEIYNSKVLTISFHNNLCDKNETFELEV